MRRARSKEELAAIVALFDLHGYQLSPKDDGKDLKSPKETKKYWQNQMEQYAKYLM